MADQDTNQDRPGRILNLEVPGDTNSADIVDRTGEQMPRQSHDGVTTDDRESSTTVNDEDVRPNRPRNSAVGSDPVRHDNPRTGRISDW
jgi:hypothetical protein